MFIATWILTKISPTSSPFWMENTFISCSFVSLRSKLLKIHMSIWSLIFRIPLIWRISKPAIIGAGPKCRYRYYGPYTDIFLIPIFFKEPILWTNFFKIIGINFYIAFTIGLSNIHYCICNKNRKVFWI